MPDDDKNKLELSTMLSALRAELCASQQEAQGKDIKFSVEDVELEIQLTVANDDVVKGGVKFWVANVGAESKESVQITHKIKLKLKPENPSGGSVKVNATGEK